MCHVCTKENTGEKVVKIRVNAVKKWTDYFSKILSHPSDQRGRMTVLAGREPVTPYQPGDHVRQKRCISTLNIRIGGGAMLTYSTSNLRTGV